MRILTARGVLLGCVNTLDGLWGDVPILYFVGLTNNLGISSASLVETHDAVASAVDKGSNVAVGETQFTEVVDYLSTGAGIVRVFIPALQFGSGKVIFSADSLDNVLYFLC